MQFSVLISIYDGEIGERLVDSLNCVFYQTLLHNEVILVIDGPINESLEIVINDFQTKYPVIKIVRLEKNQGLGIVLNLCIAANKNDLITCCT